MGDNPFDIYFWEQRYVIKKRILVNNRTIDATVQTSRRLNEIFDIYV